MRKILIGIVTAALIIVGYSTGWCFTSGSTGADGPFNPTANIEVQLPENGILNYTTVNIPSGVTVTFRKNAANMPAYILATGNVTIAGTISVNGTNGIGVTPGAGAFGAFDGGYGGSQYRGTGGKGIGPGGGNPGSFYGTINIGFAGGGGGFGSAGGTNTANTTYCGTGGPSYGNVQIIPMIGGSGGGGAAASSDRTGGSGGGGGGAILIASSGTIDITGSITANGGNGGNTGTGGTQATYGGGGGSGGAIRLMANTISGNGVIAASGGTGGTGYGPGGAGGEGRVRLEANALTRTASTTPFYTFSAPGTVFVTNVPTLNITSISGVNVFANPTGKYGAPPDVTLPSSTTNPVTIVISATNIPVGTTVNVSAIPEHGSAATGSGTLTGSVASSTASASVTLSTSYQSIIMAQATFAIQQAMYWDDEKIEQVRVAATMGGKSEVMYITEKGREITSTELMAKMTR